MELIAAYVVASLLVLAITLVLKGVLHPMWVLLVGMGAGMAFHILLQLEVMGEAKDHSCTVFHRSGQVESIVTKEWYEQEMGPGGLLLISHPKAKQFWLRHSIDCKRIDLCGWGGCLF